VNEIVVADTAFKRTNSSSSLQLRDIFEEVDSDDETLSTSSTYSSNSASDRKAKKLSSKGNNGWLPWPKKNDGNNLLVSFPSLSKGNGSSTFLAWPKTANGDNDGSWERHYV
jgi:hypothetical protein